MTYLGAKKEFSSLRIENLELDSIRSTNKKGASLIFDSPHKVSKKGYDARH